MSNIIKAGDVDFAGVLAKVRALLSVLPKARESSFGQAFHGLVLVTPEGQRFILSVQGSETHYCDPLENLDNLGEYNKVEIGILPMEENTVPQFRFGTKAYREYHMFELEKKEARLSKYSGGKLRRKRAAYEKAVAKFGDRPLYGRRLVREDEVHGWLMPSDLGFQRLEDTHFDDVLGYVFLEDLVHDLADFFVRGGVLDGEHKLNREWIAKLTSESLLALSA